MSSVLYRKYRSQNFDELIGQEHITKLLKNAIKTDQISHAYLFVGSRGTGKTSTARILSKALNCLDIQKDGNPCGKCDVCTGIAKGSFLDLIEIDAASNRGIDQIRELKEKIEFSPTEGKYKVYIIDEVHMLTTEAFNALLKTLEEPPAHVIFILATTEVHKLPSTILSRCQRYDFRLGTEKEIEELLKKSAKGEKVKVENDAMEIFVRNAKGSYRDALSLLDVVISGQPRDGKEHEITADEVRQVLGLPSIDMVDGLLTALLSNNGLKALEIMDEIESKGVNLSQFVSYTLEVLREVLVGLIKGDDIKYDFVSDLDQRTLLRLVNTFLTVERNLKGSTNQVLILQMIIPEYCTGNEEEEEDTEEEEDVTDDDVNEANVVCSVNDDFNFDSIKKNWDKVALGVKPVHRHLFAFLGSARPIKYEDGNLYIEVPFKFHKDQIDTPQSRAVINTVIKDMFNASCKLVCEVNENYKPRAKSSADVVLKAVPAPQSKPEPEKKSFKPKAISKEVEAIFEGM